MYQSSNKKTKSENVSKNGSLENRKDATSRHRSKQAAQLQEIANGFSNQKQEPIQRAIDVFLKHSTDSKKKLVAKGEVEDFQGGTSAGDRGWIGVTKYRSRYTIEDDDDHEDSGTSGSLQNAYTNPEAGHVLAKQNGGYGNDAENVFAQDGGTNNRDYRIFENQMRRDLNKYDDDDDVEFVSYLEGDDLTLGSISEEGLSSASDISSEEDDSMSTDE